MGGFEDKLNEILSSPESMEQIFTLAKSFEGGASDGSGGSSSSSGSSGSGGENPQFPPIDPKIMAMLGRFMGEYSKEDRTVAALGAIKPFLKEEKQERVTKAMEMARLARIAKLAIGGMDKNV